jgi:hypothetical protein
LDDNGRSTAYADLLSALLALRADPATARFDAELAAAEANGLVDGSVARTLRWWQRESMRGLADHLAAVLPDLLTELLESDRAAAETVRAAQNSWAEATATLPTGAPVGGPADHLSTPPPSPFSPAAPPVAPGGPHLRPVDDIDDVHRGASSRPALRKAPPAPPGSAPVDVPIVGPVAPGSPVAPDVMRRDALGALIAHQLATPKAPLRPGFAPSTPMSPPSSDRRADAPVVRAPDNGSMRVIPPEIDRVTDATTSSEAVTRPPGAPRTRLLVAGLTVLTEAVSDHTVDGGTGATDADDEPSADDGTLDDPV